MHCFYPVYQDIGGDSTARSFMLLRKKLHFVKYVADAEAVVVSK